MCFGSSSTPEVLDPATLILPGPDNISATDKDEWRYVEPEEKAAQDMLDTTEMEDGLPVELGYTRKRLSGQTLRGSQRIGGVNPRSLFQLR